MTDKLLSALKKQVNAELYSSYLYFSMSTWCTVEGWIGAANWMYVQAKEELEHGLKLHKYLLDIGEVPSHEAIEAPQDTWNDLTALFNSVLEHEKEVTSMINEIANIALDDRDHACYEFILWFVKEQVEEISNASIVCYELKRANNDPVMLTMLDKRLGNRK